jgi:hypothetical protein
MQTPVHVERSDVTGGTDMRTRHGPNYSPGFVWMSMDWWMIFCFFGGELHGVWIVLQERATARLFCAVRWKGDAYNRRMAEQERGRSSKRSYWNWLLATPLVLLVYPGMYARSAPALLGFPFFYWYQFAVVVATALLTGVVYWLTRSRADEREG